MALSCTHSAPRARVAGLVPQILAFGLVFSSIGLHAQAVDPGVRGGAAGAGSSLTLTADETPFFLDGQTRFTDVEAVTNSPTGNNGLGPRFNSNSCASCHSQPAIGGSSPVSNPLFAIAAANGATNVVPWFIAPNGPIREARFQRQPSGATDGGVHDLFVITGRTDAVGCKIAQPVFTPAGNPVTGQGGNPNIIFRIPTPTFGAGLVEAISDSAILANMAANATAKARLGISGHPNRSTRDGGHGDGDSGGTVLAGNVNTSGNDGTITRFGWKAQNKSLPIFAGEAYNVEMGVSNQLFPQERDTTPGCKQNPTPEDTVNFTPSPSSFAAVLSDVEAFANFMRMLAPPTPAAATPSTTNGSALFVQVGCSHCHTPSLTTDSNDSGSATSPTASLSNQAVNLFSDLIVHHMGTALADGITQGAAGPDEFRSAPLWGVGQRVFFLHDGRTSNLLQAIAAHSSPGSEANGVIGQFNALSAPQQQDLVNFLRSL